MKEPIQQAGHEVAIVIYDAPLPPKYFRLSKKFLRTLFVAVPIILGLFFGGIFLWGLGSRLNKTKAPTFPSQKSENEIRIAALETELNDIKQSNIQLTEKLTNTPTSSTGEEPFLLALKRPYGMQNLMSKNLVNTDQYEIVQELGKLSLKFQIFSTTPEQRVTGHVLVFLVSAGGIMAYPAQANASLSEGIKYSTGEPFAVSRLRPTTAVFQTSLGQDQVKFLIYIFSREGDLLLIKETASFQTGTKK